MFASPLRSAMAVQNEHSCSRDAVNLSKRLIGQTRPEAPERLGQCQTGRNWNFPAQATCPRSDLLSLKIALGRNLWRSPSIQRMLN
jgi:hypothetical protein